jgi:hypothetical protein
VSCDQKALLNPLNTEGTREAGENPEYGAPRRSGPQLVVLAALVLAILLPSAGAATARGRSARTRSGREEVLAGR